VLHIWDDEQCIKLLNKCYNAIPHQGKLIIAEAVLDTSEDCDPAGSGQVMDMIMLKGFR